MGVSELQMALKADTSIFCMCYFTARYKFRHTIILLLTKYINYVFLMSS